MVDKGPPRRSTNPFDSSSDEEDDDDVDVFHDCHHHEEQPPPATAVPKKREAKLDFNFDTARVVEQPALRFDRSGVHDSHERSSDFFSPLEAALLESWRGGGADDDDDESSDEQGTDEEDDTPTSGESKWLSLMKKASGTLMGSSPEKRRQGDGMEESTHGRLSRRDSGSSFASARSAESGERLISASSTPSHSRQGSFKGVPMTTASTSPRGSVRLRSSTSPVTTPTHSRQGSLRGERGSSTSPRGSIIKRRSSMRRHRRRSSRSAAASISKRGSPVLEKLDTYDRDSDFDSPWTKMILLEELGTASSWTVLLLPYIVFIISVLLDTHSPFTVSTIGPLDATSLCANATSSGPPNIPLLPGPLESCSFPYALETGRGILASGKSSFLLQTFHYKDLMSNGIAFCSGLITGISPMSTFLSGDVFFHELSTDAITEVAKGMVMVSTVALQQVRDSAGEWAPVFISRPERLSLACIPNVKKNHTATVESRWNCTSPEILDVVFSMPGTGILTGGDLQVYLLYSAYDSTNASAQEFFEGTPPYKDKNGNESFVFDESIVETVPSHSNTGYNAEALLSHLVRSSLLTLDHESKSYTIVKISIRISTLTVTLIFTLVWCWSLGIKGFFLGCCYSGGSCWPRMRQPEDSLPLTRKRTNWMWWESPWIVFPERRYLLVLLVCLVLIQNPLLVYAYFRPHLYGSAAIRTVADIMVGFGVHGVLMMWLFLVQGVRYHTAAFARRRAKHQRQILELRRAAKYSMTNGGYGNCNVDEEYVSRYIDDYFEKHGDVDGIRSAGDLAIRLKSDPCGDSWADFLLPKLFLFGIGVLAVCATAIFRFPTAIDSAVVLDPARLHRLNVLYVSASIIQMIVLLCWIFLILRNTVLTGEKLRKEPFLSTRPAQLAYRVLLGMLILGVGALVVPLLIDLFRIIEKWSLGHETTTHGDRKVVDRSPVVDVLIRILWRASQKFPYSGTAASIGPGQLLFATTFGLVSAFIFLPSKSYYEADQDAIKKEESRQVVGDEKLFSFAITERMSQRRDKRRVLRLARHTHTWRAFPLPIKKVSTASKVLSETSFQLNRSERSAVYVSRYTPVFCVEIACWLLEASWQAYYSPKEFSLDDWAPGRMALESVGLRLEHSIVDESLRTQAYIASNVSSQVDGEEDSIIVVAFRGTANSTNMKTDLSFRQVPLFEQIMGPDDDQVTFEVRPDRIDAFDTDCRFWSTPMRRDEDILRLSPANKSKQKDSAVFWHDDTQTTLAAVQSGAKSVIKAVPLARQALPCVHEGFLEAYAHIRQEVFEGVLKVLQRQFGKAVAKTQSDEENRTTAALPLVLPKIYCTGHSLGGSLAQLLALDIASNCELVVDVEPVEDRSGAEDFFLFPTRPDTSPETRSQSRLRLFSFEDANRADGTRISPNLRTMRLQPPIAVYSYGQPRVGNHAFARMYKAKVPHTFRVACEGDAFTTMPPTVFCGWSGIYKHAGLEVMLDEGCTGNILVGPTIVETLFRFTKVRTSVAAHSMERYRDGLESALGQDELEEYYRGHGSLKETRGSSDAYSSMALPEWLTQIKREQSES